MALLYNVFGFFSFVVWISFGDARRYEYRYAVFVRPQPAVYLDPGCPVGDFKPNLSDNGRIFEIDSLYLLLVRRSLIFFGCGRTVGYALVFRLRLTTGSSLSQIPWISMSNTLFRATSSQYQRLTCVPGVGDPT